MLKLLFLHLILRIACFYSQEQITTSKVHAYKMQVIHNTNGSTEGWFPCDFYVQFSHDKNDLKSISLSANNKNDLTAEDVRMLIGYKSLGKQLNPVSITLVYMLSSTYITLNSP